MDERWDVRQSPCLEWKNCPPVERLAVGGRVAAAFPAQRAAFMPCNRTGKISIRFQL